MAHTDQEGLWCSVCPKSDYVPHRYPAHKKTHLPGVPHGKLPLTGRSMEMQEGRGAPSVWEVADKLLAEAGETEKGGFDRFTQKRNRPWTYYLPICKPMGEPVVIEDEFTPLTRWTLYYNWMNRGFYPCCDPNNPAGSGTAQIIRKDGYLYPLDERPPDLCPKDCQYCDEGKKCEKCLVRPPPRAQCPKNPKDKCKPETFGGDQVRAPLYRERNEQM